jgi:nitroreductase
MASVTPDLGQTVGIPRRTAGAPILAKDKMMHRKTADAVALFDTVIRARRSVRAFRPEPVPKHLLVEVLDVARAAPSNFNSQPWRVYVLTGAAKQALSRAMHQAHVDKTVPPFSPFPQPPPPDTKARVDEFGRRLYGALGIDRTDMAARARQTGRGYLFFDAPVGLIFTIDAALTKHSWFDCGIFLQTLMLAAQARGLATCPQVSFVRFQTIIAAELGLGPEELVTCGMSLGYADGDAPVNRMDMPREPLDGFTRWLGFDA